MGGLVTGLAIPLFARVRRLGGPADNIAGLAPGADSPCARAGLPDVVAAKTQPHHRKAA